MIAALAALVAAVLAIDGPGMKALSSEQFVALSRVSATWTVHGKTLNCSGPALIDVVAAAGVPSGDKVRGAVLTTIVVATAADGYRAAFSVGELDRTLGNASLIVADRCDGAALPDGDGPFRLIAPNDKRGARGVRALIRLTVMALPTP